MILLTSACPAILVEVEVVLTATGEGSGSVGAHLSTVISANCTLVNVCIVKKQ